MDSTIEIVAVARAGRTVVRSIRSAGAGHFAARQTDADVVHLVGTAAGPLGGDHLVVSVHVQAGARLRVRSAGATIVQPGRLRPDSVLELNLRVDEGGDLDLATEPTVVCHGARHDNRTTLTLSGDATARVVEQVLLGRSYEPPGDWSGRTVVTRDTTPVLRHSLHSASVTGSGGRVISTLLDTLGSAPVDAPVDAPGSTPGSTDPSRVRAATHGTAVAMPLAAGGLLVTATGAQLLPVQADLLAAQAQALAGPPADLTARR